MREKNRDKAVSNSKKEVVKNYKLSRGEDGSESERVRERGDEAISIKQQQNNTNDVNEGPAIAEDHKRVANKDIKKKTKRSPIIVKKLITMLN